VRECVANAEIVVALEALAAAQALDLRDPMRPGRGSDAARRAIREVVPHLDADRELGADIDAAIASVTGDLVGRVEETLGPLA
jgi:histidine ammonia-lyase